MSRPTGVLVIGILGIIGGILGIIGSVAVFGAGTIVAGLSVGVGGGIIVLGVIYLILAILELIMAIAFLGLKRWAWWGLMIMLAANIILAIALMGAWQFGASSLIGILIDAGIIWYINTKPIKGAFFGTDGPDVLSRLSGGRLSDESLRGMGTKKD
jgi:hypothetical protein